MKKSVLIIIGIIMSTMMFAQKNEKIESFATVKKPMSWYKEQIVAWKSELDKNKKNEDAWYNYYKASRIVIMHDEADKSTVKEKDARLAALVEDMGKSIPNSYEYNFCKWQIGSNDMKYYSYLLKAIEINPNREENIDYMINIGEITRNSKQRDEFSIKKINAGLLSSGMMYYNYNQLIGLEKNAILLTSGDNDTYPSWALQAKGVRTDVKVINLFLLHKKEYREKIFNELGIPLIEIAEKDEKDFFNKKIVQHIHNNKNKYPVYLALTSAGCNEDLPTIENELYLIGLVYKYDTESFDNMAILKKNIEQLYALDYLDKPFYNEISTEWVSLINQNYIVPMLKLYEHYKSSGDLQKQNWIKEKLILISKGTEQEKEINKYLD